MNDIIGRLDLIRRFDYFNLCDQSIGVILYPDGVVYLHNLKKESHYVMDNLIGLNVLIHFINDSVEFSLLDPSINIKNVDVPKGSFITMIEYSGKEIHEKSSRSNKIPEGSMPRIAIPIDLVDDLEWKIKFSVSTSGVFINNNILIKIPAAYITTKKDIEDESNTGDPMRSNYKYSEDIYISMIPPSFVKPRYSELNTDKIRFSFAIKDYEVRHFSGMKFVIKVSSSAVKLYYAYDTRENLKESGTVKGFCKSILKGDQTRISLYVNGSENTLKGIDVWPTKKVTLKGIINYKDKTITFNLNGVDLNTIESFIHELKSSVDCVRDNSVDDNSRDDDSFIKHLSSKVEYSDACTAPAINTKPFVKSCSDNSLDKPMNSKVASDVITKTSVNPCLDDSFAKRMTPKTDSVDDNTFPTVVESSAVPSVVHTPINILNDKKDNLDDLLFYLKMKGVNSDDITKQIIKNNFFKRDDKVVLFVKV